MLTTTTRCSFSFSFYSTAGRRRTSISFISYSPRHKHSRKTDSRTGLVTPWTSLPVFRAVTGVFPSVSPLQTRLRCRCVFSLSSAPLKAALLEQRRPDKQHRQRPRSIVGDGVALKCVAVTLGAKTREKAPSSGQRWEDPYLGTRTVPRTCKCDYVLARLRQLRNRTDT